MIFALHQNYSTHMIYITYKGIFMLKTESVTTSVTRTVNFLLLQHLENDHPPVQRVFVEMAT